MSLLSVEPLLLSFPIMNLNSSIEDSIRDPYEAEFCQTSEHFAFHYGSEIFISEDQVSEILSTFEDSWHNQINSMGYPEPQDTTIAKFNIYLGDSQAGLPASYNVSGYYGLDREGWPMIVLGEYVLNKWEETQSTIPHEFFHAIQHSLDVYRNDPRSKWYWEATATWMETQHFPEDPMAGVFLFGFLFHPHLPINYYEPVQQGNSAEYYTYGAFLFPYYISEEIGNKHWIRDSWLEASSTETPLNYLTNRIQEEYNMADVIFDFSSRSLSYDIGNASIYETQVENYEDDFRSEDNRITVTLPQSGITNFSEPPFPLYRSGFHHIDVGNVDIENPVIELEVDAIGSLGSIAEWRIGFFDGDSWIQLEEESGVYRIEHRVSDHSSLVIAVWSTLEKESEVFTYQYRVFEDIAAIENEESGGCRGQKETNKSSSLAIGISGVLFFFSSRRRKRNVSLLTVIR